MTATEDRMTDEPRFSEGTREKALQMLAEFAESKGLSVSKFEARGDEIVMLAGTRWEHDDIIVQIREQIPRQRRCKITNVDLQLTSEPQEPIPDLIVVPEPLKPGAKPWAHETELLVEVVSQRNFRADYEGKRLRYALSGAPQYLLVDPREGLCLLYSEPVKSEGTYKRVAETKFGRPLAGVDCMDGGELDTSEFLRYT
ncbi:Uma2 family endonuclease [Actinomadura barringtoniae]|uniref:Uma2 family endonuclease n=1 Tax=Actinomadura barringtoniae TaxID=1427535 RepID=A0A939PK08_9ACTN|nr:Uma2 family endonuclease [Actinomadura barringtoniae]MBO2449986.1 Uma2 family endonuclease [Actinomadura barringtoniae]